ncbi:DUF6183 family protein [Kitasatospora sp. NPDC001540]|uniref:DUF6183 family protein n=1 Tax=Kitasatospora sp. NPDC001540 TaxID=3364014 RepID=UPI0036AF27F6
MAPAHLDAFRRLFDLIAAAPGPTPESESIGLALDLLTMLPHGTWRDFRHQASALVADRPATSLAAAFTGPATEQLRLCLVRELELRGTDPADVPEIVAWAAHRQRTRRWTIRSRSFGTSRRSSGSSRPTARAGRGSTPGENGLRPGWTISLGPCS